MYSVNIFVIIILTSLIFFGGCTLKDDRLFQKFPTTDANTSIVTDQEYDKEVKYEYKIVPNDRLYVAVYVQSNSTSQQMNSILANNDTARQNLESIGTSTGLLVTQKGTIRLPLIGSVKVANLTEDQVSKILIKKYKKYIRNPYVEVKITNQRIIVIGEVKKPGIVPVTNGTMNLVEAISRCGYLTNNASRTNIKIVRGDLRHPQIRNIDLTDGKSIMLSSLLLQPNDIVYIQARRMSAFNKAFNETVPFFSTVSSILNPFVQRTVIMNKVSQ